MWRVKMLPFAGWKQPPGAWAYSPSRKREGEYAIARPSSPLASLRKKTPVQVNLNGSRMLYQLSWMNYSAVFFLILKAAFL